MAAAPQATGGVEALLTMLIEQAETEMTQGETVPVAPSETLPAEDDAAFGAVRPGAMPSSPTMAVPQAAMATAGATRRPLGVD